MHINRRVGFGATFSKKVVVGFGATFSKKVVVGFGATFSKKVGVVIKFFSSFCDSKECKSKYERLCETHKMPEYGKTISITTGDDYTHAIILNIAMPALKKIPKANVIGLAFEPPPFLELTPAFIRYAEQYIGKYFIGDKSYIVGASKTLPDVFKEHYAYMWHITPLTYVPLKNKLMSIMVSNKNFAPGHKYRHALVDHILRAGFPIDIYGRGAVSRGVKDARLKGAFKELEPYEHYTFHICIENFVTNAYFSEKLTNTLLCGTTPIYLGCRNILDYFPANVIVLSGDIVKDMTLLRDILLQPRKYTANLNMNGIKEKLNLLKNVERLFGEA